MPPSPHAPYPAYFGLRSGRTSFLVSPNTNPGDLFGQDYKNTFSDIYAQMEERSYSSLGYKAVIWGDFGLGKTQFFRHVCITINRPAEFGVTPIPLLPVYIKQHALKSKAAFAEFASELLRALGVTEVGRAAEIYVADHGMEEIESLASSPNIPIAFEVLARYPGRARQLAFEWLCGSKLTAAEASNIETAAGRISGQLTKGKDFASVMCILALIILKVDGKILTYLVDEAERLESISDPDTFAQWLDGLRGITELEGLGVVFAVGSATRDNVPDLLLENEIERRIGPTGYRQLENLAESDIRDFLMDALAAMRDTSVAVALTGVTLDADQQKIWPFDESGFDAFVDYCQNAPLANRPSEILNSLQNLAARCYREGKSAIDSGLVTSVLNP